MHSQGQRQEPELGAREALRALVYWLPVLVVMVLFAQVALLGLRPAVCERRRLSEAETALRQRHERDLGLRAKYAVNLAARQDPIFLERQRRLRLLSPQAQD